MGREAKILLAFLGLLAGVFCGVLSMKLLVPRPPAGAGPDVHGADTFLLSTEIVDPPLLPLRAADFAAAPPLMTEGPTRPPKIDRPPDPVAPADMAARLPDAVPAAVKTEALVVAASDDLLPPAEFVLAPPARPIDDPASPPAEPRDPFLAQTAWSPPDSTPEAQADFRPDVPPVSPRDAPAAPSPPQLGTMPAAPAPAAAPVTGSHIVRAGESWWSLAEAAYGDGRFYRALFAWNRAVDPRITLAAGTQLEVPPLDKLRAAWPKLLPPSGP
jgi:hypothetical protein